MPILKQMNQIIFLNLKFRNQPTKLLNWNLLRNWECLKKVDSKNSTWQDMAALKKEWMSVFWWRNILTISNLLSSATVQGKTTVDPAWAKTLVLFFVAKILTAPKVTFGKNCWALLNNRLPSSVPSLFMKKQIKNLFLARRPLAGRAELLRTAFVPKLEVFYK